MDNEGLLKAGSESQDSDEPAPPGISKADFKKTNIKITKPATLLSKPSSSKTVGFKLTPSVKGVENAKKRLRAFSIQKKTPITPVALSKAPSGGGAIFIGKLSNVKVTPKPDDVDQKKPPKPPKPGQARKILQDSYTELQKRTLIEIEDMKRKMELVELGIPLGLICPSANNDKAMPTKAMPPIKTFLDPAKLDEIIREAKKAKADGKEFKFDYQKLLPDYDNPFQRKKEELERVRKMSTEDMDREVRRKLVKDRDHEKDRRKSDKYDKDKRYSSHRKDEKDKRKVNQKKHKEKPKEKTEERKDDKKDTELTPVHKKREENVVEKNPKETDVNLNDYLICDSWSLDNDDKPNMSPKVDDKIKNIPIPKENKPKETPVEIKNELTESPLLTPIRKIEKLQPVIDSFKFEIEENEDELLDMFDENSGIEKFATKTRKRDDIFDSPIDMKGFDFDQNTKESADALTDDTFLESVINEIKQEDMSDDSQDKGLVEYDSPSRDGSSPPLEDSRLSITPELDDAFLNLQSSRSDYSDGYRSTESGYKSTESGYKSNASYKSSDSKGDNYRLSMEKEVEQMNKATVDSLETWSFVLKICQPLLFRHDRNKCYRETRSMPKIWFTENPKLCSCVKDRAIVYEELETCKMSLVDRVYGCDQIPEVELPKTRTWYPRFANCLTETSSISSLVPASEWEADDSQTETPHLKEQRRTLTPVRNEEVYLDREYQRYVGSRFMQAVWPENTESKAGTPRSTTPVRQDTRKKKAEDKDLDDKKKAKKMKLSSEGWSQESDIEEEAEKRLPEENKKKAEKVKVRKRKHSPSVSEDSEYTAKKSKKAMKKKVKESKKTKEKLAKRKRKSKKYLKKLKEKQKKKRRDKQLSEDEDAERQNRKREKKLRKKKLQKKKKALKKKKAKTQSSSSSSSSSTTTSSSETDSELEKKKKKKKKNAEVKKKKRQKSSSDSVQSEELFDVNILNNIKTERLTDDEKNQSLVDFSPRRQKPREIINVKELQNDFVGNNTIHIKKEVEEVVKRDDIFRMEDFELTEREFATERAPEVPTLIIKQDIPEEDEPDMLDVQEIKQEISFTEIPLPVMAQTEHRDSEQIAAHITDNTTLSTSIDKEIPLPVMAQTEHRDTEQIAAHITDNTTLSTSIDKPTPEHSPLAEQVDTNKPATPLPESPHLDKEPQEIYIPRPQLAPLPEESNLSQCSSQESTTSKDVPYEKDDSHLRPSSQNSNYSFNDVISASQHYQKDEEEKSPEYEQGNYEMYEQLAMAYQSDVAKQSIQPTLTTEADSFFMSQVSQRIETVVRLRSRGEIKCDWRAGDEPSTPVPSNTQRPSRWGLKPGEVNIVLTCGDDYSARSDEPVYQIQTIANRSENNSSGSYDEAYEDMYGASDRLQYGDCFNTEIEPATVENGEAVQTSTLDDRINKALQTTVLGEVAQEPDEVDGEKDSPEKGILVVKAIPESRGAKRVSFADGYKPGQDSDVEEPPVKKKKKSRRQGCAWPCPATHIDHVPLWDALPPPPPPPGSPPPNIRLAMQAQFMMMQAPNLMQAPNMMQPPNMMQQSNMLQQPPSMLQQPPGMLQQPPSMLQQPPSMMQQPPSMLQQPQSMLQQQGINSMMSTPPFSLPQKLDPSVSLPNFLPPEPPPRLLSYPLTAMKQ